MNRLITNLLAVIALAIGLLTIQACKTRNKKSSASVKSDSGDSGKKAVSMNDMSYLFPKNAAGEIYPRIDLSEGWLENDTPILRKALFDQILAATLSTTGKKYFSDDENFKYDSFVVASFRIDPCAPSLAMDETRTDVPDQAVAKQAREKIGPITQVSGCIQQVRLIIQPANATRTKILNSSIHLVYRTGIGALVTDEMIRDILDLKAASPAQTDNLSLLPHPGLSAEAATNNNSKKPGPFALKILAFLKKYTTRLTAPLFDPQNIAIIRNTTSPGGNNVEVMIASGTSSGNLLIFPMPTLPQPPAGAPTVPQSFTMLTGVDRKTFEISPVPPGPTTVSILQKLRDGEAINESDKALMMLIDNPEATHFFGTDCVSCHTVGNLMLELDPASLAETAGRYPVPKGVWAFPFKQNIPPSQGVIQPIVRNFGYTNDKVTIGTRTITETASVVDYLNKRIGVSSPGADCQDEKATWKAMTKLANYTPGKEKCAGDTVSLPKPQEPASYGKMSVLELVEDIILKGTKEPFPQLEAIGKIWTGSKVTRQPRQSFEDRTVIIGEQVEVSHATDRDLIREATLFTIKGKDVPPCVYLLDQAFERPENMSDTIMGISNTTIPSKAIQNIVAAGYSVIKTFGGPIDSGPIPLDNSVRRSAKVAFKKKIGDRLIYLLIDRQNDFSRINLEHFGGGLATIGHAMEMHFITAGLDEAPAIERGINQDLIAADIKSIWSSRCYK